MLYFVLDVYLIRESHSMSAVITLAAFSVFVGALIGAAGIGGVLLVPFMAYALSFEIHTAIAGAMFGYIFAGGVGALLYARHGSIEWDVARWLILGAMPAAFLGSFTASAVSGLTLEAAIAALLLFAGLNALRSSKGSINKERQLGPIALMAIGAVAGFGSSMTGTGGPLIIVPLLLWLRFPAMAAVGLSQATQFPLATLATAGNVIYGKVDYEIGTAIAVGLVLGVILGAKAAHALAPTVSKRIVAWVTVIVGLFVATRLFANFNGFL